MRKARPYKTISINIDKYTIANLNVNDEWKFCVVADKVRMVSPDGALVIYLSVERFNDLFYQIGGE